MPVTIRKAHRLTAISTFFPTDKHWPLQDFEDPLGGYFLSDVLALAGSATNDIYGAMHNYMHDFIHQFCERIATLDVSFLLYNVHATALPSTIAAHGKVKDGFDRIDVRSYKLEDLS